MAFLAPQIPAGVRPSALLRPSSTWTRILRQGSFNSPVHDHMNLSFRSSAPGFSQSPSDAFFFLVSAPGNPGNTWHQSLIVPAFYVLPVSLMSDPGPTRRQRLLGLGNNTAAFVSPKVAALLLDTFPESAERGQTCTLSVHFNNNNNSDNNIIIYRRSPWGEQKVPLFILLFIKSSPEMK